MPSAIQPVNYPQGRPENDAVDRAQRLRAATGNWIGSADSKGMALLTVGGALLALLAAVLAGVGSAPAPSTMASNIRKVEVTLFLTFCVADVVSIAFSAWAILPRTNRVKILADAGWTDTNGWRPLSHSRSFFRDLAGLHLNDFLVTLSPSDDDARDEVEQAFVLQRVAMAKMDAIRRSVIALVIALVSLGALLALVAIEVL